MISVKLLNGNIISRDADFSKYIETVSEPGVIKGFVVSATEVGIGMARVPVSRSNGENLFVLVISDSETSISGDGDVYINIPQEIIDNGEIANEDGTGIATIEVGTMPSKNALKLATISNGAVTDERNMLKKVSDLEPLISALDERTTTLEEEVGEILDKGAIDHLEESGLVGEKYTLSDTLFMQQSPLSSNCTLEANVGDVDANKQIHIQRMGSGTESNQIQLKLKKVGEPTQNLIVEIRRGVKVDVSNNEAYWYGNEVITSSSIAYGNITTDFAEYTVTFPQSFGATQGELLDVVVRQNSDIVNSTNYYVIACDSTQYSEAYSYVAVNGETRARSKLMPYCSSSGFAQSLLCKVGRYEINRFLDEETEYTAINNTNQRYTLLTDLPIGTYKYEMDIEAVGSGIVDLTNHVSSDTSPKVRINPEEGTTHYEGDITTTGTNLILRVKSNSIPGSITVKRIRIYSLYKSATSRVIYEDYRIGSTTTATTYSYTCDITGYYQFDIRNSRSSDITTVTVAVNNENVASASSYAESTSTFTNIYCEKGDLISISYAKSSYTGSYYLTVTQTSMIFEKKGVIRGYPNLLKEIGLLATMTTYGEYNGEWKGLEMVSSDISESYKSGTISLGNCYGFITVRNINDGAYYKIPIYKA